MIDDAFVENPSSSSDRRPGAPAGLAEEVHWADAVNDSAERWIALTERINQAPATNEDDFRRKRDSADFIQYGNLMINLDSGRDNRPSHFKSKNSC